MRFNTVVNNVKCLEWGISATQGALFDLLNQLSTWASHVVVGDCLYYHISKNKIIGELPLFYTKKDTVYRHLRALRDKGLIRYIFVDGKDLVCLTEVGKTWNSSPDIEPPLGFRSELPSDSDPTNNNYNSNNKKNVCVREKNKGANDLKKSADSRPAKRYENKEKLKDAVVSEWQSNDQFKDVWSEYSINQFVQYWAACQDGESMRVNTQAMWSITERMQAWMSHKSFVKPRIKKPMSKKELARKQELDRITLESERIREEKRQKEINRAETRWNKLSVDMQRKAISLCKKAYGRFDDAYRILAIDELEERGLITS
jgi:hypothetical protein